MRTTTETVRTKNSEEGFEFECPMPETLEEAAELYGAEHVFAIFSSGLKVKLQNIAREGFKQEKPLDEINAAVAAYRPGNVARRGLKTQAMDLLIEKNDIVKNDPDLHAAAREAFGKGDFKVVVDLLQDA
jgi:hypothetical protein